MSLCDKQFNSHSEFTRSLPDQIRTLGAPISIRGTQGSPRSPQSGQRSAARQAGASGHRLGPGQLGQRRLEGAEVDVGVTALEDQRGPQPDRPVPAAAGDDT